MKEYEIYRPTCQNDGTLVDADAVRGFKETLAKVFGGYTHIDHRSEGAWQMGGVTFRDEVTIVRVLDDGSATFDMRAFKRSMAVALKQEAVLIIVRKVAVV